MTFRARTKEAERHVAGEYRRGVDAVTREIAGETLLVPIRGHLADLRRIYSLNPVGAYVWDRLEEAGDGGALAAAVAEAFEVEPAQAERDVRTFLDQLVEAGLASVEEGGR